MSGWVKLHRSFKEWEWRTKPEMVSLFIHLLLSANHKNVCWQGVQINRGQVLTGRKKLSINTGLSEQKIRTCIKRLKSTNEITIKSTKLYSLITLVNFDLYQSEEKNQPTECHTINQQLTNDQPTINQQLTTNKNKKECKEVKEGKKKTPPTDRIKFDYNNLELTGIKDYDIERWESLYPGLDIKYSIKEAKEWLINNPGKKRSNIPRFLTSWFSKSKISLGCLPITEDKEKENTKKQNKMYYDSHKKDTDLMVKNGKITKEQQIEHLEQIKKEYKF